MKRDSASLIEIKDYQLSLRPINLEFSFDFDLEFKRQRKKPRRKEMECYKERLRKEVCGRFVTIM